MVIISLKVIMVTEVKDKPYAFNLHKYINISVKRYSMRWVYHKT